MTTGEPARAQEKGLGDDLLGPQVDPGAGGAIRRNAAFYSPAAPIIPPVSPCHGPWAQQLNTWLRTLSSLLGLLAPAAHCPRDSVHGMQRHDFP